MLKVVLLRDTRCFSFEVVDEDDKGFCGDRVHDHGLYLAEEKLLGVGYWKL